jgi:hypothetical protein
MPRNLIQVYRRFGGTYYFNLQGLHISPSINKGKKKKKTSLAHERGTSFRKFSKNYTRLHDFMPKKNLLFIVTIKFHINDRGLFNDAVSSCTLYTVKYQDDKWTMNYIVSGRRRKWPAEIRSEEFLSTSHETYIREEIGLNFFWNSGYRDSSS